MGLTAACAQADEELINAVLCEPGRLAALEGLDLLDTPAEEEFDRVTRLAQNIFRVPMALISLVDDRRQWFKSRVGVGVAETPVGHAFCRVPVARRAPLVVPDATLHPMFAANPLVTGAPHIRFYAGAPLIARSGHAIGTLCIADVAPRRFGDDEMSILIDLSRVVVHEFELRLLADVDALTGSLSRRAFFEEGESAFRVAKREDAPLSVVLIDLDRFKSVNDTHGHAFGDAVLQRSIEACMARLPRAGVIGRIGGEEFAALLPGADSGAALAIAEELRVAVAAEVYKAAGRTFGVTASFGVATLGGWTSNFEAIVAGADAALYRAKADGRNRCVVAASRRSVMRAA